MHDKIDKEQRLGQIMIRLLRQGTVETQALSQEFVVSDTVIRNDFNEIDAILRLRGIRIQKVYGGARLVEQQLPYNGFYDSMEDPVAGETLELLGEYVVSHFIKNRDRPILLDGGRTIDAVARQIVAQKKRGLRLMTHSYSPGILSLYAYGEAEIVQLGGFPVPLLYCYVNVTGGDYFYEDYWSGPFKAILGGTAFNCSAGLMSNSALVIAIKQRYIKAADEIIVVLDHTKFSKRAVGTVSYCGLKKDPWLIDFYARQREAGLAPVKTALPLTIVTDLPRGGKVEDFELTRYITPQVVEHHHVCLFQTEIPLV